MQLKVISTFSGVGGLDHAIHCRPEFKIVAFVENDKYASSVLRYHYPRIINYGDITKIKYKELPDCEVIVGGPPCQNFSTASDDRSGRLGGKSRLLSNYIETIKEKKPRYIIWENVTGFFSANEGMDVAYLQHSLAKIGYAFFWKVLDASNYGSVQERKRVFLFGYNGEESLEKILHESEGLFKNSRWKAKFQKDTKQRLIGWSKSSRKTMSKNLKVLRVKDGNSHSIVYDRIKLDNANTLNRGDRCFSRSSGNFIVHGKKIRYLTPLECERLMLWKDDWTKYGKDESGKIFEISDNQRYAMCGNGVVSTCVEPFLELIIRIENERKAEMEKASSKHVVHSRCG